MSHISFLMIFGEILSPDMIDPTECTCFCLCWCSNKLASHTQGGHPGWLLLTRLYIIGTLMPPPVIKRCDWPKALEQEILGKCQKRRLHWQY